MGYRSSVTETLRLTIAYDEPDEGGWIVARVIEVPGAISQGRTVEEARANVIDALRLMLAPDDDPDVAAGRWQIGNLPGAHPPGGVRVRFGPSVVRNTTMPLQTSTS